MFRRFQANLVLYQNLITKALYDKQLDSGRGTLLHLCDDVIQQEVRCHLHINFAGMLIFFLLCHSCGVEHFLCYVPFSVAPGDFVSFT